MLAEAVTGDKENMPVRMTFQDEARFGRMSDPRKCWAPWPIRPLVKKTLIREYDYAYAAVTPADGRLDWMLGSRMDFHNECISSAGIRALLYDQFVAMVLDGAPSHRSTQLEIPANMALLRLPSYSPELNPVEHLWNELSEKEFANKVFDSLEAAIVQLAHGMWRLESSPQSLQYLTG